MTTSPVRIRSLIEPIVAILFFIVWAFGEAGRNGTDAVAWLPYLAVASSIALSRLLPIVAISIAGGLVILQWAVPLLDFDVNGWAAYFGLALTLIGLLVSGRLLIRRVALAAFVGMTLLIAALPYRDGGDVQFSMGRLVERFPISVTLLAELVVPALCWLIAFGLRAAVRVSEAESAKRSAIAELKGTEDELSMAVQRDRIAQDVHDIMAHSLSVIVAQADGARFVGKKRPAAIEQSLEAIAQSARESLAEVRMLIETLVSEPQGHSHPSLENLDALIERMESAGVSVTSSTFGDPGPLTSGQELAVYRIVQEALTNALKHGGQKPSARVVLDWRGMGLALNVSSTGDGEAVVEDASSRGIYGMRERARLAGGWLTASPDEAGTEFLVTAFIPSSSLVGVVAS